MTVCVGLYAAVEIDHWWHGQPQRDSIHALGGISHSFIDEPRPNLAPGPLGLVEVWNGEVWRIWVTGLHHAGFVHLFFNVLSMFVLGALLEPRIGSFALALMIGISLPVSIVPELWMQNAVVGISGTACALFGVVLVLRLHDRELQHVVSTTVIVVTLASLFAGFVLTAFEWVPIANLAHFAGLAWGWLVGQALYGPYSARRVVRYGAVAAQLLLIPAIYFAVHPYWAGAYQWYRASKAPAGSEKRLELLAAALRRDPELNNGWLLLARSYADVGRHADALHAAEEAMRLGDRSLGTRMLVTRIHIEQGQLVEALRVALDGVRPVKQSPRLRVEIPPQIEFWARRIWWALPTSRERAAALNALKQQFGESSQAIQAQLSADPRQSGNEPSPKERTRAALDLDTLAPAIRSPQQIALDAPQVDPDDPESAALGTLL